MSGNTSTMHAAFHVAPNRLEVLETPIPQLLPGEVLIQVSVCGFCGSEKHDLEHQPESPRIPGHEFSGVVAEINGDAPFAIGDAVIVNPALYCGECDYCREDREHLCRSMAVIGCQTPGAFAEFVKAPIRCLYEKPANISFPVATLADPLAVALHAVEMCPPVESTRCLIFGAGTIGLLLAQVLRLHSAAEIWLADIDPSHLALARRLGDFRLVNLSSEPISALPSDVDLAVELAGGTAPTLGLAIEAVRKGGTVLCVAQRPKSDIYYPSILFCELRLQGIFAQRPTNFAEAVDLLATGKIIADSIITDCLPLADIQHALNRFLKPSSVKVVVEP